LALLPGKVGSTEGLGWGWITGGDSGKVSTYQRWDAASQICAAVFRRAFGFEHFMIMTGFRNLEAAF
jgi:hypothetical protein